MYHFDDYQKKCHIILAFNGVLKHETVPRTFHPICFIFTMHFWGTNHECKSRHGELAQNTKVYRFVEFQGLVHILKLKHEYLSKSKVLDKR